MILENNNHGAVIVLSEDTEITGPCRGAVVTTNGYFLTISTLAHHSIEIDSTKDPATIAAMPNVTFTVPIYPENATYTMPAPVVPIAEVSAILTFLNEGGTAIYNCWVTFVDCVLAAPDMATARADYSAIAGQNMYLAYSGCLCDCVKKIVGGMETPLDDNAAFLWMNSLTREQLLGQHG